MRPVLPAPLADGAVSQGLSELAGWLAGLPAAGKAAALGVATFVSEDLTTIFAGLLVARDELSFTVALVGCTLGIWVGDGLLFVVGRTLGRPALRLPILRGLIAPWQLARAERWFAERGLRLVLVSRFLPGSRLPAFFAAGLLGARGTWFLGWALVAALLWTPLLIGASIVAAPRVSALVERVAGLTPLARVLAPLASVLALVVVLRSLELVGSWRARRRWRARWVRRLTWEFWPPWVIYAPVFAWYLLLALRHRSLTLPTVANPGMEAGGFIGESKGQILEALVAGRDEARPFVVATARLAPGGAERLAEVTGWMGRAGLRWPIVLKPDAGQRGSGVRLIEDEAAARDWLAAMPLAAVAQQYAQGPHELGVFWVREPGAARGRILSVTSKFFPTVVGDGRSTLEDLILRHERAWLMAPTFFRRHGARLDEVLPDGERLPLVTSGNHCQGALFKDGRRHGTDALCARLDRLADGDPLLFVGRFDLRGPDLAAIERGEGFKIVELNGATAEATHIYDPDFGRRRGPFIAWRTLCAQWSLMFALGAANRAAGHRPLPLGELLARLLAYRRHQRHHPR